MADRRDWVTCPRCSGSGWVSRVLAIFALLAFCAGQSQAATVTGLLSTASSNPYATNVLFTPWSTPLVDGNLLIGSAQTNVFANSGGAFSVTLKAGDYKVNVGNLVRDTFWISVPTNIATYNLTTLITNELTYSFQFNPSYLTSADASLLYVPFESSGATRGVLGSWVFGQTNGAFTVSTNGLTIISMGISSLNTQHILPLESDAYDLGGLGALWATASMRNLLLYDSSQTKYVAILPPFTGVSSSYAVRFPTGQGTDGQILTNDGSGNLGWWTPVTGNGSGDVLQSQLNNASNVLRNLTIANDTTTSNGVVTLLVANDTTTSNALRTLLIANDTTTSNGLVTLLVANDTTTSNALRTLLIANDTTTSNGLVTLLTTASNALQSADVKRRIVFAGDSLTTETSSYSGAGNEWPAQLRSMTRWTNTYIGFTNAARGAHLAEGTMNEFSTNILTWRPDYKDVDQGIFLYWEGINDIINGSKTDVQTFAFVRSNYLQAKAAGFVVVGFTLPTNNYVGTNATFNGYRVGLNTLIRQSKHLGLCDEVVDLDALIVTTNQQPDGLHFNTLGNLLIASNVNYQLGNFGVREYDLQSQRIAALATNGYGGLIVWPMAFIGAWVGDSSLTYMSLGNERVRSNANSQALWQGPQGNTTVNSAAGLPVTFALGGNSYAALASDGHFVSYGGGFHAPGGIVGADDVIGTNSIWGKSKLTNAGPAHFESSVRVSLHQTNAGNIYPSADEFKTLGADGAAWLEVWTYRLKLSDDDSAFTFTIDQPDQLSADIGVKLPSTNAVAGQVLTSDGAAGNLYWTSHPSPAALVTNSIWVDAGAMRPIGGDTTEGGRAGASIGSYTNAGNAWDTYDLDDTTNECVQFRTAMSPAFAGPLTFHLHWMTTNSINGASNVVWEVAATVRNTNSTLGSYTWTTNLTDRFWSSNSLQVSTMPLLTISGYNPRNLLDFRISRLGTNASDAAVGDVRLLGAELRFVATNLMGGF